MFVNVVRWESFIVYQSESTYYFKGRKFRDFAIFGKIRESLFPRNICYLEIAKVHSREKNKTRKSQEI